MINSPRTVRIQEDELLYSFLHPFFLHLETFYYTLTSQYNPKHTPELDGYISIFGYIVKERVELPINGLIKKHINNERIECFEIRFFPSFDDDKVDSKLNFKNELEFIFNMLFIGYYESVKDRILDKYGVNKVHLVDDDIIRMGWLVRNSITHNRKISFSSDKSKDIVWRGKTISHLHHNDPFSFHFSFVDTFILMMDIYLSIKE